MNSPDRDLTGFDEKEIEAYHRGKAQGEREGHWLGMAIVKDLALQQKTAESRAFEYKATHDQLTGLHNRYGLNNFLTLNSVADSVFLYVDGTNVKNINDKLGHAAGDRAIVGIADVLRGAVREEDFIARVGGDEFIVIIAPTRHSSMSKLIAPKKQVPIIKERVVAGTKAFLEANQDLQKNGLDIAVGASLTQPGDTIDPLMQIATAEISMQKNKDEQHILHGTYR